MALICVGFLYSGSVGCFVVLLQVVLRLRSFYLCCVLVFFVFGRLFVLRFSAFSAPVASFILHRCMSSSAMVRSSSAPAYASSSPVRAACAQLLSSSSAPAMCRFGNRDCACCSVAAFYYLLLGNSNNNYCYFQSTFEKKRFIICCFYAFAAASSSSPCGLPAGSWSWSLPRRTSTISDWSLECASPACLALPSSAYFAGCLAGGFLLATLADSRLGRKNKLVLSSLAMSLTAALTAASPSLLAYAALRFVCGFGRATVGTSALVLSTELVSRRWRERVGIIGILFFTMGFLSLPGIAYLTRGASWRTLYLLTSLPCFLYTILIYFFMTESPCWLLLRGRRSEAIATIKSFWF